MHLTDQQVIDALRPVQDPELHRSIVDLEMVREVDIDERTGCVSVLIALTVAGCPLRAEITDSVTAALMPLAGVDSVDVDMTVMTAEELDALRSRLQGAAHHSHGNEAPEAKDLPFGAGSSTRVIGISSGKGGVGKSSVTVNLAVSLSRQGYDVAILDADVYGFSIPGMLGIDDAPEIEDGQIVPPVAHGVRCVSLGFFVDDKTPVMWRGPMLHKALEQFLTDVKWANPDYLLIDMPPGTGDVAMSIAKYLPRAEIFVVTTPQAAAQRVAQRSGAMARELQLSLGGVIENMSWFTGQDAQRYELFGSGGGVALAESLGVPMLAQIPLTQSLREGGDAGTPVVLTDPASEAAYAFERLAKHITQTARRRVYREELRVRS